MNYKHEELKIERIIGRVNYKIEKDEGLDR